MEALITLHDALCFQAVRPAFEWLRGRVRRHRRAYAAYHEGLRFRATTADWTAAQRDAWVLAQLRRTLRYAYATTRYYRRLWDELGFDPQVDFGWDDFARLPVLTRADLHACGAELHSHAVPDEEAERDATGGSTGRPVEIRLGPLDRGWSASGIEHTMRLLGVGEGIRRGLLWGHHLVPVRRKSMPDRILDWFANRRWYECLRLSNDQLLAYDQDLRRFQPRCLVAYASALAALAELLEARGAPRPNYPTRCFVTGAEKLFEHQRALIERVFGRPVHERYGSRDLGGIAFQYRTGDSLHYDVDWALVLVEPAVAEREAPLLVTKLHGDGMPMIRYVNDDVARFPVGAQPGRPCYVLEEVIGRRADRVVLPDGRWLNGLHFPHLLKDFPLRDFQVHQAADYRVTVRLVLREGFAEMHRQMIEANIRANLPGLPVEIAIVEHIPRTAANKWRPVVSEVVQ